MPNPELYKIVLLMTEFQKKYPKAGKDRLLKQIIQTVRDEERGKITKTVLKIIKEAPLPGSGE